MSDNEQVVLRAYADGVRLTAGHLAVEPCAVPEPAEGEVLLAVRHLAVDPYLRSMMLGVEVFDWAGQIPLGTAIQGNGVGEVVASRHPDLAPGDMVEGAIEWKRFSAVPVDGDQRVGQGLRRLDPAITTPSHAVGVLGMPGMNAYFGMLEVTRPLPGETVLISSAAGGIGSLVGQFARLLGARVIGLASAAKCEAVVERFGYHHALDYRAPDLKERILELCPTGPDVYFDNVGGETSQVVLNTMRHPGRVVECGQISTYDDPSGGWNMNIWPLHMAELNLQPFIGYRFLDRWPGAKAHVAELIARGVLDPVQTEVHGLERMPEAFVGLFDGVNVGKLVLTL